MLQLVDTRENWRREFPQNADVSRENLISAPSEVRKKVWKKLKILTAHTATLINSKRTLRASHEYLILLSLGALGLKYISSNRLGKSCPGSRMFCSRSCRFRINLKLVQGGRSIRGGFWQRADCYDYRGQAIASVSGAGVKPYRPPAAIARRRGLDLDCRRPRSVRRTIVVNRHLVNPFTARSSCC